MFPLIPLLALGTAVQAQNNLSFEQYLRGLGDALKVNQMGILSNALGSVNGSESGAALLEVLYRGTGFTLFAPVDSAWDGLNLTNVEDDDLVDVLSYHITPISMNTTEVAPPKKKTISFTLLKNRDTFLPQGQTQVLALETAPNTTTTEPVVYIRGTNWNATSISYTKRYENVHIQAINRLLQLPDTLINTLNTPLADPAPTGTPKTAALISSLSLNETLNTCRGCTFLIPIDSAYEGTQSYLDTLGNDAKTALLKNHVINGTTVYSPALKPGANFVTAAGHTLGYATNSTGAYLFGSGGIARFVRTDIIVNNGVVHLIDRVFNTTTIKQDTADQAISSASQAAAEGEATLAGVLGTATSLATPDPTGTSTDTAPSGSGSPSNAASNTVPLVKMSILALVLGVCWMR